VQWRTYRIREGRYACAPLCAQKRVIGPVPARKAAILSTLTSCMVRSPTAWQNDLRVRASVRKQNGCESALDPLLRHDFAPLKGSIAPSTYHPFGSLPSEVRAGRSTIEAPYASRLVLAETLLLSILSGRRHLLCLPRHCSYDAVQASSSSSAFASLRSGVSKPSVNQP
jgi:hypothetical protein